MLINGTSAFEKVRMKRGSSPNGLCLDKPIKVLGVRNGSLVELLVEDQEGVQFSMPYQQLRGAGQKLHRAIEAARKLNHVPQRDHLARGVAKKQPLTFATATT